MKEIHKVPSIQLPVGELQEESSTPDEQKLEIQVGHCLELLNPVNLNTIHAAFVSQVFEFGHRIELTYCEMSCNEKRIQKYTTVLNDYKLLPPGFCEKFGLVLIPLFEDSLIDTKSSAVFSWYEYYKKTGRSPSPENILFQSDCLDVQFNAGQKLEVEHTIHSSVLCVATITNITDHLLWIRYDTDMLRKSIECSNNCGKLISKNYNSNSNEFILNCLSDKENIIALPFNSDKIFPHGWAQTNCNTLAIPSSCLTSDCHYSSFYPSTPKRERLSSVSDPFPTVALETKWCPDFILNYLCFPGPFLSKHRLSCQSGIAVGGSVSSVLSQVVTQTLGAAYSQSKLTKDFVTAFQLVAQSKINWESIQVKAKCKRFSVRSKIMAPMYTEDVHIFMSAMFDALQCCPNLWSFTRSSSCPHNCKQSSPQLLVDKRFNSLRLSPQKRQSATSLLGDKFEDDDEEDDNRELKRIEQELSITKPPEIPDVKIKLETVSPPISVKPKLKRLGAIIPADVSSDPLLWSVEEVFEYISKQPSVSHHAGWLKSECIDGHALLLLDLYSLLTFSRQPHASILPLTHELWQAENGSSYIQKRKYLKFTCIFLLLHNVLPYNNFPIFCYYDSIILP